MAVGVGLTVDVPTSEVGWVRLQGAVVITEEIFLLFFGMDLGFILANVLQGLEIDLGLGKYFQRDPTFCHEKEEASGLEATGA